MPHKHKRLKIGQEVQFDLPPTKFANPLPVGKRAIKAPEKNPKKAVKKSSYAIKDDTPKAFARLMQFRQTGKGFNGLDNGNSDRAGKKRKRNQPTTPTEPTEKVPLPTPKIKPGERLGDFAARVDQEMPVSGLARKGKSTDGRQTKHEKRLQKMVNSWKEEEARRREKEEEERELAEEDEDEEKALWATRAGEALLMGGKKGKKKDYKDDDPWAELHAKRDKPKGLHDVAEAPPSFQSLPREKFKIRNGAKADVADVPNAAGSLKRREELSETRRDVIARYREMMGAKRRA